MGIGVIGIDFDLTTKKCACWLCVKRNQFLAVSRTVCMLLWKGVSMSKKRIKITLLIIAPIVAIAFLVIVNYPSLVREMNRITFLRNVARLEDGDIVKLRDLATFDWDSVYRIGPYSDGFARTLSERYAVDIRVTPSSTVFWFLEEGRVVATIRNRNGFRFCLPILIHRGLNHYIPHYFRATRRTPQSTILLCPHDRCFY